MEEKINLLVLPGLFPEYEGDIRGIFILDYLESVRDCCNISVFVFQFFGKKKGLNIEKYKETTIFRYVFSDKQKVSKIRKYIFYLRWFKTGKKLILKNIKNIQIIHAHGSVLYGNLARIISKSLNVPFIISEHAGPFLKISNNKIFKYLSKKSMEKANAVLLVSNDLKIQIEESSIKPRKTITTYNPINTDLFSLKKDRSEKRCFLFAGRLEYYKGALRSVKAFKKVFRKCPDWEFKILGDGPENSKIKTYLKKNLTLEGKIKLLGKLSKKQMSDIMQNCDFFLYPSEHETFGIIIAEAMSCGLPVIVGNNTAPREFVDKESGLLIDPLNIDKISNAIEYMINNHNQFNPELIRKKIIDRFSFEVFGNRLINIYKELL